MPLILALETILWCGVLNVCNALSRVNEFVVLGTVVGNCTEKKKIGNFYAVSVSMFYNAVRSAVIILTWLRSKAQLKCSHISVHSPREIFLLRNLPQTLYHSGRITLHNLRKTIWSYHCLKNNLD